MKMTGVDIAVRALEDEDIPFTFGIPGTHNIELFDSLIRSKVRPVLVTDEQSASAIPERACVSPAPGTTLATPSFSDDRETASAMNEALSSSVTRTGRTLDRISESYNSML